MAADPKKDFKAGADDAKALQKSMKGLPDDVRALSKLHDAHCKALAALDKAYNGVKPAPAKGAKLGEVKQLEAALKAYQTAAKYEELQKARDEMAQGLSPKGRQRAMLNNLISVCDLATKQHTGDKKPQFGGRSMREVLMALKELREGDKQLDEAQKRMGGMSGGIRKLSGKSMISDLTSAVKEAESSQKSMGELDRILRAAGSALEGSADTIGSAFSDAVSEKSA